MAHRKVVLEEETSAVTPDCDYDDTWVPASKGKAKANGRRKYGKKTGEKQQSAASFTYPPRPRRASAPVDIAHNLCGFTKRRKPCRYGKRCKFAHSEEELKKWEDARLRAICLLEDARLYSDDYDDDDSFPISCDDGFCTCNTCTAKRYPHGVPPWTSDDEEEYVGEAFREVMATPSAPQRK